MFKKSCPLKIGSPYIPTGRDMQLYIWIKKFYTLFVSKKWILNMTIWVRLLIRERKKEIKRKTNEEENKERGKRRKKKEKERQKERKR